MLSRWRVLARIAIPFVMLTSANLGTAWPAGAAPAQVRAAADLSQVRVAAAVSSVGSIAGDVTAEPDQAPLPGALLTMIDGAGRPHQTSTDDNGRYAFVAGKPDLIAPGAITITVTRDGFVGQLQTLQGKANGQYRVNFVLAAIPTEAPSSPPEATQSAPATGPASPPASGSAAATGWAGLPVAAQVGLAGGVLLLILLGLVWLVGRLIRTGRSPSKGGPPPAGPIGMAVRAGPPVAPVIRPLGPDQDLRLSLEPRPGSAEPTISELAR
jgi:Carboxypeptidase regulatory-like domain